MVEIPKWVAATESGVWFILAMKIDFDDKLLFVLVPNQSVGFLYWVNVITHCASSKGNSCSDVLSASNTWYPWNHFKWSLLEWIQRGSECLLRAVWIAKLLSLDISIYIWSEIGMIELTMCVYIKLPGVLNMLTISCRLDEMKPRFDSFQGPLLRTWFNFNPSRDDQLHPL